MVSSLTLSSLTLSILTLSSLMLSFLRVSIFMVSTFNESVFSESVFSESVFSESGASFATRRRLSSTTFKLSFMRFARSFSMRLRSASRMRASPSNFTYKAFRSASIVLRSASRRSCSSLIFALTILLTSAASSLSNFAKRFGCGFIVSLISESINSLRSSAFDFSTTGTTSGALSATFMLSAVGTEGKLGSLEALEALGVLGV